MPTVRTEVSINAPIDQVYAIAKDNRSFPEFMPDLKSLTVVETDGNRVVSDYVGVIPKFLVKVRWRQEDVWDDDAKTCTFRQISGDYDHMDGIWRFEPEGDGTRFTSEMNYEYTVPTLGPLIKKVIHGIVVQNLENILQAIKKRSEGAI
ncbi:MAG: SRPBCC family protein [Fimbriimonadaceae bacterium]